jgi:hypothetical protein
MFETHANICDPKGIYPEQTVLCDVIGHSCFMNIPFELQVHNLNNLNRTRIDPLRTLLHASFLMTRREFPPHSFWGSDSIIVFKSETEPDLSDVCCSSSSQENDLS